MTLIITHTHINLLLYSLGSSYFQYSKAFKNGLHTHDYAGEITYLAL